jgi:hypothetical protein
MDGYINFKKEMIQNFENFEEEVNEHDIIAPLFARFDSQCGGGVYFHEYTRQMTDDASRDIIKRCNEDIAPLEATFSTEMALVITWDKMYPQRCDFFSNSNLYPDFTVSSLIIFSQILYDDALQPTTFQVVIAVQGRKAYAIYNYLTVNVDHQMPYVGIGFSSREGYTFSISANFTGFELEEGITGKSLSFSSLR